MASLGRGVEVEAVAGGLVEEAGQAALHRGGGGRGGGQQPVHLVTVRYVEPGLTLLSHILDTHAWIFKNIYPRVFICAVFLKEDFLKS